MADTLKMVEEKGIRSEGLQLVLVTDGQETMHPLVSTVLPKIKSKRITINTISLGGDATDSLELWAQETGGQSFCYNIGSFQSDLSSLLYSAITTPETRPHLKHQPGRWRYTLTNHQALSREKVQVLVTSRPAPRTPTPRVEHGVTATSVKFPDPVVVWARVTQGRSAVLKANVTALVSLPSGEGSVSLPLLDNGMGADHQAGDGVYAAYFTQFAGDGRYGLSVYVSATNTTSRTHGQLPPTDLKPRTKVKPPRPSPPEKVTKIEQFARFSSGGVFKVTNYKPGDLQAPGRVSDLAVTRVDLLKVSVTLEWTSLGDDHYTGTASHLELTYQMTRPDLPSPRHKFNATHLTAGLLTPLPAGLLHTVTLKVMGVMGTW
ncbi:calcium-activated chloride channel regulator 1-like [Scylla paramamosain]|uniref:calcium-activated chloride channel regulator 1-like n=1 Tax=Scylla paramamosain TaxID=85552 RepID=UPI0030839FF6